MASRPTSADIKESVAGSFSSEISPAGLFYVVGRHKSLLFVTVIVAVGLGVIYSHRQMPMFESSCRLLIEQNAKADLAAGASSKVGDTYVHAQMQLLTSALILDQSSAVLRELNLKSLRGSPDIAEVIGHEIVVSRPNDDGVITVACTTPDASDSAAIVNAVVDAYRTFHLQEENRTDHDSLHFFQLEKDKHDTEVNRDMTALADFKAAHPDFAFQDNNVTNIIYLKLTKLNDELTDAQASALNLSAKYKAAAAQLPAGAQSSPVLASDDSDIDATWVQSELNRTNANLDALEARGEPPTNVAVQDARAYQSRLRQKLAVSQRNTSVAQLAEIKTQLDFAKAREEELQNAVDDQKSAAGALNTQRIQLDLLTEQLKRAQKASDEVDGQLKLASGTTELPPEVRVLDHAHPATASTGTEYRILSIATAAGLLAGVTLSYTAEALDTRLRTPEEASGILGLPVLGMIPQQRGKPSVDLVGLVSHTDPMSAISDGVRRVRSAIFAASRSTPAKTILVTSPTDQDGKSIFAANLAIVMAQSGSRTLLIDANFRSPSVQKIYDLQRTAGLADVISGKVAIERAIRRTPIEGLEVLSCGTMLRNPPEMLNGTAFARLIKQLGEKYQCILLDSPSVLSVPDARILGATADLTVMVVRTGSTTRKSADQGLDQLLSVGSRVLGVVVNGYSLGKQTPRLRGALRSLEVLPEVSTLVTERAPIRNGAAEPVVIAVGSPDLNQKNRSNINQQVDVLD